MSRVVATLRRVRELHLERAHRFLDVPDWWALVLEAASGDVEAATDTLGLLDVVTPGESSAEIRVGGERLEELQRKAESAGIVPTEDPVLRFYRVGLAFDFWAQGNVFLADDSPEVRAGCSSIYRVGERKSAEVAAVIGKACVLAEARASAPKRLRVAVEPTPAPAPVEPVGPAPRSIKFDGFTQEPEEDRDG